MARRTTIETKKRQAAREIAAGAQSSGGEDNWLSSSAVRETIESVIIAFVLAFLFRTFEAEAFVIPTGSMAPTLMGKHKDVECPMCHYRYQANASDDQTNNEPVDVPAATCPMCRYTANLRPDNRQGKSYPSYDGDRILVAKFPYEFADPQRWDVVVFKYPGNSTMNYIKRLVGLPGETIRIQSGDLWIHKPGDKEGEFAIARKPPPKILAMLQPVYDNDLAPNITGVLHWPARWTAEPGPADFAWNEAGDLSSFATKGAGRGEAWIRYRHRVPNNGPDYSQWQKALEQAAKKVPGGERPQKWLEEIKAHMPETETVPPALVADFTAYNSSVRPNQEFPNGVHWVGDLAVQFEIESGAASGKVIAELVKGGRHFRATFDLATGMAELSIDGESPEAKNFHPKAATALKGPGKHTVIFSNVDDELRLWVDSKWGSPTLVDSFDGPTTYDSAKIHDHVPTLDDLSPVGIGAVGADVTVRHIRVLRDIYYIAVFTDSSHQPNPLWDYKGDYRPDLTNPSNWKQFFGDGPNGMQSVDIPLKAADPKHPATDRFFVLGDNSAFSQDGRLWCSDQKWRDGKLQYWVDRELFIGKALFIYWPHGWGIPYVPLPFNPIPNFGRMHLVR